MDNYVTVFLFMRYQVSLCSLPQSNGGVGLGGQSHQVKKPLVQIFKCLYSPIYKAPWWYYVLYSH